jgi:hypothetical protein
LCLAAAAEAGRFECNFQTTSAVNRGAVLLLACSGFTAFLSSL